MEKIIKKSLIIAIYIGIFLLNTKVYANTGTTINDTTRIRREPSTESETLDLLDQNESVEILSDDGDWYQIKYKDQTGYIRKDLIQLNNDSKTEENTNKEENSDNNSTETSNNNENNTTNEQTSQNVNEQNETINTLEKGYTGKLSSSIDIKIVPTINSSIIATIYENTDFTVTDIINKWAYIETQNNSGWVLIGKVKSNKKEANDSNNEENKQEDVVETPKEDTTEENKEIKEEPKTVTKYVSAETLNLREKADNNANIINQLTLNSEVTVVEVVDNTWSKITYKGTTGYIASKYLSDTKVKASSRSEEKVRENVQTEDTTDSKAENNYEVEEKVAASSASDKGYDVVAYAKQFLGNPYVYGGTSLTNGCDCSGFVMSIYSHFGYSLPHSSSSMRSVGRAVSKSELVAGDIVCFSGHVGIYIGGNSFIHAANANKGIIISSLSESYYTNKYVGARRVL